MPSIRTLGQQFAADRIITRAEANELVLKVKQNGIVSRAEKLELRALLVRHADAFDPAALQTIKDLVGVPNTIRPTPAGSATRLSPADGPRQVFLTDAGVLSLTANGAKPSTPAEVGEAMFRTAELVDDAAGNLFMDLSASFDVRKGAFEQTRAALAVGSTRPAGVEENQALQTRASAATVLLQLIEATPERDLKAQMLASYEGLIRNEPNKFAREVAIFHLSNSAGADVSPVKELSAKLMTDLAPTKPPYDKWFVGGNKVVNLSWTVGESEFWKNFTSGLKRDGFKPVGPENQHGVTTYEKTFNQPGVGETTFRIDVKEGGRNLLEKTADSKVHIMGYDGHSGWGKNMTSSIRSGPQDASGGDGKMFIYNLCVGKGVLDQLRTKYPNMQPVATFGASYLDTDIDGMCELLSKRADWQQLDGFFNRTDGFSDKNNFVTPVATLARERVLDRDNDGQADYLDKHFNYNTFNVPADTAREFTPVKQTRDAKILDGTKVNVAAQMLNTVSEFSSILERVNADSKVVAAGFFEPKLGEKDIFRFTTAKGPDGKTEFRMSVSARYAHMSEEALRASAVYEFDKWLSGSGQLRMDPVDAKLNGIIGFAQSLDIDESSRDDEVWKSFLGRYNLPDVDRNIIQGLLNAEHHHYAGTPEMISQLKAKLSPATLAELKKPQVGEPIQLVG